MRVVREPVLGTLVAAVMLSAVAACGSTVVTPSPSSAGPSLAATPTAGLPIAPTPVPTDVGATPRPSPPAQSDTDWGRIWDGLPASFPHYPGASPTETGEGPASAILDVGAVDPAEVAAYYTSALEFDGYVTLTGSGPREDGSDEIEWAGEATCRIRATITPLGGTTVVTILYRADCPFD